MINDLFDNNSVVYFNNTNCQNNITGYGRINSKLTYFVSQNNSTVTVESLQAILNVQSLAFKTGNPIFYFLDSDGLSLEDGLTILTLYSEVYANMTSLSQVVPQIGVVTGRCVGHNSYMLGLCDFVISLEGSEVYTTGVNVMNDTDTVHVSDISSDSVLLDNCTSHLVCADIATIISKLTKLSNLLPANNLTKSYVDTTDDFNRLVSDNTLDIFDVDSSFPVLEFVGNSITTTIATVGGIVTGIVDVKDNITYSDLLKATKFVQLCNSFNIPIVNIVNSNGLQSSKQDEINGLTKQVSHLLYAYTNSAVPKITVAKNAIGVAYTIFASKSIHDLLLCYPTAQISAISAVDYVNAVCYDDVQQATDKEAYKQQLIDKLTEQFNAKAVAHDCIQPEHTRIRIIDALQLLSTKRVLKPAKKSGNYYL